MFQKYFEMGYSVIPVSPRGKNPVIKDWTRFCREKPSEKLISEWDSGKWNLGVTCGPASNIICVDIDTDDKVLLDMCPPSPVRRRGKKGEARFFRYRADVPSQSFSLLDILADGRQVLLPPSIHPETEKPYTWLTPDTLENMRAEDLPDLDIAFLTRLRPTFQAHKNIGSGRNNKLVDMVSAMRGRGEQEMKIVQEVYDFDSMYHEPRLFTDSKEGFRSLNEDQARENAWLFVTRVTKSLIEKGVATLGEIDGRIIVSIEDEEVQAIKFKPLEFPEPQGLLKTVKELIEESSPQYMPNLALGGAVALLGAVFSNRARWDRTWTNVYVMNLAPTGAGKSFPQSMIKELLTEKNSSRLLGYGNYKSSSALVKNLVSRRERLDVIDEISSLFAQMKSGGLYQMEMVEELCKLWSESNTRFIAGEYSEREDTASCYNPCVSLLGSSTLEGVKRSISTDMVVKGLIPRFLIFSHEDYGDETVENIDKGKVELARLKIEAVMSGAKFEDPSISDLQRGPRYAPVNYAPHDKATLDAFGALRRSYKGRLALESSETMKYMLTRGIEQIMRLAVIHAAGRDACSVEMADLTWARKVFEVSLHNSRLFLEDVSVDSKWETDLQTLSRLFQRKVFLTEADISRSLRSVDPQRMKLLLKHLLSAQEISVAKKTTGRQSTAGYRVNLETQTQKNQTVRVTQTRLTQGADAN